MVHTLVLELVLPYLDTQSILNCREVSYEWNVHATQGLTRAGCLFVNLGTDRRCLKYMELLKAADADAAVAVAKRNLPRMPISLSCSAIAWNTPALQAALEISWPAFSIQFRRLELTLAVSDLEPHHTFSEWFRLHSDTLEHLSLHFELYEPIFKSELLPLWLGSQLRFPALESLRVEFEEQTEVEACNRIVAKIVANSPLLNCLDIVSPFTLTGQGLVADAGGNTTTSPLPLWAELPNLRHFGFHVRKSCPIPSTLRTQWRLRLQASQRGQGRTPFSDEGSKLAGVESLLLVMQRVTPRTCTLSRMSSVSMNFEGWVGLTDLFTAVGGYVKHPLTGEPVLPPPFAQTTCVWPAVTTLNLTVTNWAFQNLYQHGPREQKMTWLLNQMFPCLEKLVATMAVDVDVNVNREREHMHGQHARIAAVEARGRVCQFQHLLRIILEIRGLKQLEIKNYNDAVWRMAKPPARASAHRNENLDLDVITIRTSGGEGFRLRWFLLALPDSESAWMRNLEVRVESDVLLENCGLNSIEELRERLRGPDIVSPRLTII